MVVDAFAMTPNHKFSRCVLGGFVLTSLAGAVCGCSTTHVSAPLRQMPKLDAEAPSPAIAHSEPKPQVKTEPAPEPQRPPPPLPPNPEASRRGLISADLAFSRASEEKGP